MSDSPNIVVLCSWYNESPVWLSAMVTSVAAIATHVVALDGAYALFPEAEARSPVEEHTAIIETALAANIGVTVHAPKEVWWGNEVEKRAALFEYGKLVARPGVDWFLVMDADEIVTQWPVDIWQRLERTGYDACTHTQWEDDDPHRDENLERLACRVDLPFRGQYQHRKLFRCLPGLTVRENHFRYYDGDRLLWGEDGQHWPNLEPAEDMATLKVRHRINRRSLRRGRLQSAYYKARDTLGVEESGYRDAVAA